jgi:hypothetical protein
MKLLRDAMGTERDEEEPKVGILGEKRDRDDDSSDSDIWDHDSDGTRGRGRMTASRMMNFMRRLQTFLPEAGGDLFGHWECRHLAGR